LLKTAPPTEDVELRLRIDDTGELILIGVIGTGIFAGREFVVARNIVLESLPKNMLDYSQLEESTC
jgi:hypothetical protein